MSQLDNLLAAHYPDGVPHKKLGDIATLLRGNGMPKTMLSESGVGAIHYGQIYTKYGTSATKTISFVSEDDAKKLTKADSGDIIITNTSENLEDVGKAVAWLGTDQIVTGGHATVIKHDFDPRFLSYWFQTPDFYIQKKKLATGTKVIDVSAKQLEKIVVPVPSVEIQRHIADILDTFSKMEAELEAELEARKQQYEHYKSDVFRTTSDTQRVRLGEVADILQGFSFKSSSYVESGIRVVRISDVQKGAMSGKDLKYYSISKESEIKRYMLLPGDLVMSLSGSVGRVAMLTAMDVPAALNQRVACIRPSSSKILTRYLFHYLNTDEFEQRAISSTGNGTVKNISSKWLKDEFVPLPSMETQNRIIDILDKFDALVNDLSVGLPAELAARRQQYEYYRDRLLTFKELEPAS